MKTPILFLFVTVLLAPAAFAQNTYIDYKVGLKLYNRTSYEKSTTNPLEYTSHHYEPLHLAPAVQWRTLSGNFNEVELTDFRVNYTETAISNPGAGMPPVLADLASSRIGLRYEYIFMFRKRSDHRLVPAVGLAANPYFHRQSISPWLSNAYQSVGSAVGMRTFVVPRLSYYFNNRLFADFNIPLCLSDSFFSATFNRNPNRPIREQRQSSFEFNGFPGLFSARIGVGMRL